MEKHSSTHISNWREYLPEVKDISAPGKTNELFQVVEDGITYEGDLSVIVSITAYFENEIVKNQCLLYNHIPKMSDWYIQVQLFEFDVLDKVKKYSVDPS